MQTNRTDPDRLSSPFWFVSAMLVCRGAAQLGVGGRTDPGPGFVFFWAGLILALLSLMVFLGSFRKAPTADPPGGINRTKIAFVIASLLLYALFFESLGFLLSTFLLIALLLRVFGAE